MFVSLAKSEYRVLKCECFASDAKENAFCFRFIALFRTTVTQFPECRTGTGEVQRDDFAIRNRDMKKKKPAGRGGRMAGSRNGYGLGEFMDLFSHAEQE